MLQIDKVESPSLEEFERIYASNAKPVIITGISSQWTACSGWNVNYFKLLAGNKIIPIKRMKNGAYARARTEYMKFGDYLDVLDENPNNNERFYLSEESVARILPEIISDFAPPPYITTSKYDAVIYLGRDVHSQLHFHTDGKALLCPVIGQKHVKIFSPDQTSYLYRKLNFSKIEGEPVNTDKFPLYEKAKYYKCIVSPGEMLYFPIFWWHGVYTPDFNCSIVFFWDDPWRARLIPPAGIPIYSGVMFQLTSLILKGIAALK